LPTIIAIMMRTNYNKLPEIGALGTRHGANFQVNVYQAVKRDAFSLTTMSSLDRLSEALGILSSLALCNEPIVRAILGFEPYRADVERAPSVSRREVTCSLASIGRSETVTWPTLKNGDRQLSIRRLFVSWI
jgi:hypothetical protein